MTFDIGVFRSAFPEFRDTSVFPDTQISFWATLGNSQVSQTIFGNYWAQAMALYVAHQLALNGTGSGSGTGAIASKSVGSVSVSYDTGNSSEANAGQWNLTKYGKQYIRLLRMFGTGVVQL